MTLEEIEAALSAALKLRSPTFPPDTPGRTKVGALEDYMLRSAHTNGDLVEAQHWLRLLIDKLAADWEALQGWEVALARPRAKATRQDIQQAKIQVAPTKYEAGRKARRLAESVADQIERLEREHIRCSRAYTAITGG